MSEDQSELVGTFRTDDGRWLVVVIPDEAGFEAMRAALDDPVWLLGATWEILTTNDFKRSRFVDAFGAWLERQDAATATRLLEGAGVTVRTTDGPTG